MCELVRKNGEIHFGETAVSKIAEQFGTPLYLYDEKTLRDRCRKLKSICSLPNFKIYYSAKANTNISLLKIIKSEGLLVDAMSIGEIHQEKLAGFTKDEILFLSNNVDEEEFKQVAKEVDKVCVDSLPQLERYCTIKPGSSVYVRINPGEGKGAGHHQKVVTAGKVKFGIEISAIDEAIAIAKKHNCKLNGFQIHIGSLFLTGEKYLEAIDALLALAKKYEDIEYIDFGGGIGMPYDRTKEKDFPFESFSKEFTERLQNWMDETGRKPIFAMEPGRFTVAESGMCLATVQAKKENAGIKFIGTNLGFNLLLRPEFYGSYHEIVHATSDDFSDAEEVHVVGNVCESGDHLGKDRTLPKIKEDDILLIRDTGAYGFSMASNYNAVRRPAEVLIKENGDLQLIRKRETLEDLVQNQVF